MEHVGWYADVPQGKGGWLMCTARRKKVDAERKVTLVKIEAPMGIRAARFVEQREAR